MYEYVPFGSLNVIVLFLELNVTFMDWPLNVVPVNVADQDVPFGIPFSVIVDRLFKRSRV